jgi:hypothetical protein
MFQLTETLYQRHRVATTHIVLLPAVDWPESVPRCTGKVDVSYSPRVIVPALE